MASLPMRAPAPPDPDPGHEPGDAAPAAVQDEPGDAAPAAVQDEPGDAAPAAVQDEPGDAAPAGTRGGAPLTDGEFSAAVGAVTSAFGDPTRRRIYLFVRDAEAGDTTPGGRSQGYTASEVAAHFELHANVARHHLDKLTAGGWLEVFTARAVGGGAGRPSKRYRVSDRAVGIEVPRRTDDLLVLLLGRALALVPPEAAETMAEGVGEEYGRMLASQMGGSGPRSFRTALHAIADALTAHGFGAHADARENSVALIRDTCPFFDAAQQHPVICAVDRGMVRGMLANLCGDAIPAQESSRALGDAACVTLV